MQNWSVTATVIPVDNLRGSGLYSTLSHLVAVSLRGMRLSNGALLSSTNYPCRCLQFQPEADLPLWRVHL